jgi:hypothetical protein
MHPKVLALGRLKHGEMNGTESAYSEWLEAEKTAGRVLWWKFEGLSFRLAKGVSYVPDFVVMLAGGEIQCHEVKGFYIGDGKAKVKVAAEMFPFTFRVILGKKSAKRDGGAWVWTAQEI